MGNDANAISYQFKMEIKVERNREANKVFKLPFFNHLYGLAVTVGQ